MQNFQSIVFIWAETYTDIFKYVLQCTFKNSRVIHP